MRELSLILLSLLAVCALADIGEIIDEENDAVIIEAFDGEGGEEEDIGAVLSKARQARQFVDPVFRAPGDPGLVGPPLYRACYTKEKKYGRCMTLNECYPERKIFRIPAQDTWIMGLLDTCSYNTQRGRQIFGVCCTRGFPQTPSLADPDQEGLQDQDSDVTEDGEKPLSRAKCQLSKKQIRGVRNSKCTMSRKKNFFKIVNGYEPNPHSFPFMAALLTTRNGKPRQFCGGSMIDELHVLTAAHCVDRYSRYDVANLLVYLGDHDIKATNSRRSVHKVKRLIKHKRFDGGTLFNDIAILTLANPAAVKTDTQDPICLPTGDNSYEGEEVIVAGWGSLRAGGPQPNTLRAVSVKVWSNSKCSGNYGTNAPGGIADHMLCAASPDRDSCSGDSGGCLFMCGANRDCVQLGIVSWGIGCAHKTYPGVYTRVTKMMPWIEKIQECY